jgi:hypothetical protein
MCVEHWQRIGEWATLRKKLKSEIQIGDVRKGDRLQL